MRVKLTAKHPRPASSERSPVRPTGLKQGKAQSAPTKPDTKKTDKDEPDIPPKTPRAARATANGNAAIPDRSQPPPLRSAPKRVTAERPEQRKESRVNPKPRTSERHAKPADRSLGRRSNDDRPARSSKTSAEGGGRSKRPVAGPGAAPRPPAKGANALRTGRPAAGRSEPPPGKAAEHGKFDEAAKLSAQALQATGMSTRAPVSGTVTAAEADRNDLPGMLRLSKRMSELGLCSRREADEWIEKGWVHVDGVLVTVLGSKVMPDQKIEVASAARAAQLKQATILLHKPVGYVSGQPEDDHEPAVVLVKAATQWDGDMSGISFQHVHLRALAPAGRLDIDSTGLLIFTQDGRIAKQLIGENSEVEKEYLVRVRFGAYMEEVARHFPADKLALLCHGLDLDDVPLKPAQVDWQNGEQLRFVLREGKKRQIRRMCELVGLEVVGLKRVRVGKVMLGALPPGQWRYLATNESF